MGLCYISVGIFTVVYKAFIVFPLEQVTAYLLGAVLIGYGIFRIGRGIYQIKNSNQDE
ncbi:MULTISPECIES: C4-dicarboxylate ABC transporter [unclassified Chryseobacterium]|uniref:C4-dicarboxylate ABC transporter n=1 Tax=unclassified Chryseobacterium TaxID=2593645 RepID=UPI001E57379B|nr:MULTISPECIES: C4-dicarboxylate ABC transporter [unclassified Chryseobacterium]